MNLAEQLGYQLPEPNTLQRAVRRFAYSAAGAWILARTTPAADRLLLRLTGGRAALARMLAGIQVLTLITTGARTGRERRTPLLGIPAGAGIAVIGTQFGQPGSPGWHHNLRAHPRARIGFEGTEVAVTARTATSTEREEVWARAVRYYPGYAAYARRIRGREIPIVVLEAAEV
jgi:deazaflavin-dependent oxidoreductase (nitroreductase family)